jgi:hypothetical protein
MSPLRIAGVASVALLFFVWPIAGTTALRGLLLVVSLAIFATEAWRSRQFAWTRELRPALAAYMALSLWMLIVAIVISNETAWSLGELRGQWSNGLIALLVGIGAGSALAQDETDTARILTVLVLALAAFVVYGDVLALAQLPETGVIGRRLPVFGSGPDKANYVTNLLLAFLASEAYLRLTFRRRMLRLHSAALAGLIAAALFAEYNNGMRNGIAEFGLTLMFLAVLLIRDKRRRLAVPILLGSVVSLMLIAATFAYLNYKGDSRWQVIGETARIAWDTDSSKAWLDPHGNLLPLLANGTPVDHSAYMRISALKEGSRLIVDHPLGIGFGRNAYGHGLEAKYGEKGLGHSHSGLMDLAIGTGIPGTLLWLTFLVALFLVGWRRFRDAPDYPPLLLMLVVGGYGFRMLVDSVIRDHMLQQFLLVAGLLAVLAASSRLPRAVSVTAD